MGWTEAGEWFNMTVEVEQEGEYDSSLLYTSNRGGTISFDVNGSAATGSLHVVSGGQMNFAYLDFTRSR